MDLNVLSKLDNKDKDFLLESSSVPTWQHHDNASTLAVLLAVLIVLISLFRLFQRSKLRRDDKTSTDLQQPPLVKGHFLFGNGKEFAEDAVGFMQRVGQQYGDMAAIRLMFRRFLLLNDAHSFSSFAHDARLDLRPIVDQVNWNIYGFKVANSDIYKRLVTSHYKSTNMQDTLLAFDDNLTKSMSTYSTTTMKGSGQASVHDFIIDTGFSAAFSTLLGDGAGNGDSKAYSSFYANYLKYMEYFDLFWLGLPRKIFPAASKAWSEMMRLHPNVSEIPADETVSGYIRQATAAMLAEGRSEAEVIGHNIEFVHVHVNVMRVAWWMLMYILSDSTAYQAVLDELDDVVGAIRATTSPIRHYDDDDLDNAVCLDLEDIQGLTALDSIYHETLRLVSGTLVVRVAKEDATIQTSSGKIYEIQNGDTIFFYPRAHHLDADIFEEPRKFKWDRFVGATFSKNGRPVDKPVVGFGTMCTGQRFSNFLAKWYLIRVLYRWRMELSGPMPEVNLACQCREILPPKCDTKLRYEPRPQSFNTRLQIALPNSASKVGASLKPQLASRRMS